MRWRCLHLPFLGRALATRAKCQWQSALKPRRKSMAPSGLEPRTLQLLGAQSNQVRYDTTHYNFDQGSASAKGDSCQRCVPGHATASKRPRIWDRIPLGFARNSSNLRSVAFSANLKRCGFNEGQQGQGSARANMAKERKSTKKSCHYFRFAMMCPSGSYTQNVYETAFLPEFDVKFGRGCAPNPLFSLHLFIKKMKEYRKIPAYFVILEGCPDFFKIFARALSRAH